MNDEEIIKAHTAKAQYQLVGFTKGKDKSEFRKRVAALINGAYYAGKASKDDFTLV